MVNEATKAKYKVSIGIECHVQLKTATKLFAAVGNDARDAQPNTLISHICLGMPGALPVLNQKALELATRMGFALNVAPQKHSIFERKHYFYPDLPKGYQITQLSQPIISGGTVEIEVDGKTNKIGINRVQIEEDAGKNTHPAGKGYSLVDLNRAGTPLLEIVSEPDIHSAAQAKAYARELYLLAIYADVSDADLYHGNMRFDVNVSVSKTDKLGIRTETKNLNSFRSVEKAAEYEINRQIELLEKGEQVVQETRGWDDAKQKTFSQRGKEEAHDYRYMPEPDVPPIELEDKFIDDVKNTMPIMPGAMRTKLKNLGLEPAAVEVLIGEPNKAKLVEEVLDQHGKDHAKRIANWIINTIDPGEEAILDEYKVDIESAVKLSEMTELNELSSTAAKEVWLHVSKNGGDPRTIAKERNLLQVSDEGEIIKIVKEVIAENKQAADDVKKGEMKAIGFLVGQVMKKSQGKANPQLAQKLIKEELN
jgi:aspartyl-tRNA(Asn)/glutamyl-tRNA(Gln) amidotransferase subunit B